MKQTNKLGFILALILLCGVATAYAQSAVHPKSYYDAITYEWTDASGVSHTNAVSELATDPYQIVALLKKVYCDPNLPGPTYSAYSTSGNRERTVYYGAIGSGWDISSSDVTAPYEDGYTIIMLALKNNLNLHGNGSLSTTAQLIQYMSDNVESAQLLTDGLRVGEGDQAGTVFNITGTYNRFFMLGKGQAREIDDEVSNYTWQPPFSQMFEQFSPTSGSEGSQITDFYAKMAAGDVYPVVHDCNSVIENEHYFSMAGNSGTEARSLTGLNIFIPDYRLLYWETTYTYSSGWYQNTYTVDGRTMNPYRSTSGYEFRTCGNLCVNYAQYNPDHAPLTGIYLIDLGATANKASEPETYDVVLDWTSSLDNLAGSAVPQTYDVYIIVTDENGNEVYQELVTTSETTYTYSVPQHEGSYTLTYIVHGKPSDGVHDAFSAWSNQASVVIPGTNENEIFKLGVEHVESDFVVDEQNNYYRNFLNIKCEDLVNGLTIAKINAGANEFNLNRYDNVNGEMFAQAATITFTVNGSTVRYNITYTNQDILSGYNNIATTSGSLGSYDEDEVIDLSSILFVDQFCAETKNNEHPSTYYYVLRQVEGALFSNTAEVNIIKTASTIDGFYSHNEVMGDTEATLPVNIKNANVELELLANPQIYYYTLERGDNRLPNEEISKLQRRSDGSYKEMDTAMPQYIDQVIDMGTAASMTIDRFDNDAVAGEYGDYMTYLPIVWTMGTDRIKNDGENSYGSPIWSHSVGNVTLDASGSKGSGVYTTWTTEANEHCCIYYPNLNIAGILPPTVENTLTAGYECFMYRVWVESDGLRAYKINPNSLLPYETTTEVIGNQKLIAEVQTTDANINLGSYEELTFGAVDNAAIKFIVRFYYKKSVRNDSAPMYYVVETSADWDNITTTVNEISAISEVSKTYYNGQGIPSEVPYDGVNIVVTRFSDGTVHTSKVVR